jgi:hypothetical protein
MASPVVSPFIVVVTSAASVAGEAAAATSTVVGIEVALLAVALAAFLLMVHMEFLPFSGSSFPGSVSGSGIKVDSGSGSGSPPLFIGIRARSLSSRKTVGIQAALDQLNRVASQFIVGMKIGVYRIL